MPANASPKQIKLITKQNTMLEGSLREWQHPLPSTVIADLSSATKAGSWNIWRNYLANRKNNYGLPHLLPAAKSPLEWSIIETFNRNKLFEFISSISDYSPSKKQAAIKEDCLNKWISKDPAGAYESYDAAQAIVCAWSLPGLSQAIPADLWWNLFNRLVALTSKNGLQLDIENKPLVVNLISGELPLALAYLFPELKTASELSRLAIDFLSESLVEMLDGEGMPKACYLKFFAALFGSWTRCRAIMDHQRNYQWNDDAENQYQWLMTQAIRITRGQGGFAFSFNDDPSLDRDLLMTATIQFGNTSDILAAKSILGLSKSKTRPSLVSVPSYHSEWAEVGILRNTLTKKSKQLSITYNDGQNKIELSRGRHIIFDGELTSQTFIDNDVLNADTQANWIQTTWQSDEDIDYLEIEKQLNPQTKLQRSFLLARADQFLLIADAIIYDSKKTIRHQINFPLYSDINVDKQPDTWELVLKSSRALARLFPIGLPEWRVGCHQGTFKVNRSSLTIEQTGVERLFVPLFVDLAPKRARKRFTWRQLSVGQTRKNLSPDAAVGYRVQIGNQQWLIYRSFDQNTPRTVLGQNLLSEYFVGRFLPSGNTETLIEIQ